MTDVDDDLLLMADIPKQAPPPAAPAVQRQPPPPRHSHIHPVGTQGCVLQGPVSRHIGSRGLELFHHKIQWLGNLVFTS